MLRRQRPCGRCNTLSASLFRTAAPGCGCRRAPPRRVRRRCDGVSAVHRPARTGCGDGPRSARPPRTRSADPTRIAPTRRLGRHPRRTPAPPSAWVARRRRARTSAMVRIAPSARWFSSCRSSVRTSATRDVVLRVVRHLPHVPRRGRVEDQFVAEVPAHSARGRLDSASDCGHLRIVGGGHGGSSPRTLRSATRLDQKLLASHAPSGYGGTRPAIAASVTAHNVSETVPASASVVTRSPSTRATTTCQ